MEMRSVTLILKYKRDGRWNRSVAARSTNGRVRPGWVLVNGLSVEVGPGRYELRYYADSQTHYTPVGINAAQAEAERIRLEKRLTAHAAAESAGIKLDATEQDRKALQKSANEYIYDAEQRGASEAVLQAKSVTTEFIRVSKKTRLDELTKDDVFSFHKALRARGCEERTVANKHQRLISWLLFAGVDRSIFPPKPQFDVKLPTVYTSDQAKSLLKASSPYMRICILLAMKCGMREQELMFAERSDIDWENHVIRIRFKAKYQFKVKAGEERDIALLPDVENELKAWRPDQPLILAKPDGKPNRHLLRNLKQLARDADLNCGVCASCQKLRECEDFTLHRFRRTFLTNMLRDNVDLRSVMAQAGHTDLKSTMRYLRPAAGEELRKKMAKVKW